jgi:hypothetical protein
VNKREEVKKDEVIGSFLPSYLLLLTSLEGAVA